ncbi:MAG: exodeoxyribonuclease VII small subunit [Candidatus Binatia bacterium]
MSKENSSSKEFEVALDELSRLVEQLEAGDLSLEDSLSAFEKGVALVKYCNQKLSEVEKKVELLVKDKNGKLQFRDLEHVAEGNDEQDD